MKRHERCRISGSHAARGDLEIPLLLSFFYLLDGAEADREVQSSGVQVALIGSIGGDDPGPRQRQVGSLAGAAHLSKDNAGVLRRAQ